MSNQKTLSTVTIVLTIAGIIIGAGGGYFLASGAREREVTGFLAQISQLESEIDSLEKKILI